MKALSYQYKERSINKRPPSCLCTLPLGGGYQIYVTGRVKTLSILYELDLYTPKPYSSLKVLNGRQKLNNNNNVKWWKVPLYCHDMEKRDINKMVVLAGN